MTYTYECKDCGKKFNIEKGINEEIEIKCDVCNSNNTKRIYESIGIVVNCTGFCGKINK